MRLRPLFLIHGHHPDVPAPEAPAVDYRSYTDDQLMTERDRRQRQLDDLSGQDDHGSATCSQLVGLDREVEQMTDELIRRARSRHPSSRGLTG